MSDFFKSNKSHRSSIQMLSHSKRLILSALFICLIFVWIKLFYFDVQSALWAEDGTVFINEARSLGITSIWTPYAGYLHLYPRLIALISCSFDIKHTPLIFFGGWLIAYMAFVYVVTTKIINLALTSLRPALTTFLLVAQPHSGEVFFTLTNAQWFTGAILAIYLLMPSRTPPSLSGYLAIIVMSLTGPFSLLLIPFILIQIKVYNDWNQRKNIYSIIIVAALIQGLYICLSNRIGHSSIDTNLHHWFKAAYSFLIFGKKPLLPQLASISFWCLTLYVFTKYAFSKNIIKKPKHEYESLELIAVMLLTTAVLFLMAGLITVRPEIVNPLGDGARYFFIPYILIFLASLITAAKCPKLIKYIYIILSIICLSTFSLSKPENLQFKSYAAFARVKPDVSVPIRPEGQWNIHLQGEGSEQQTLTTFILPTPTLKAPHANESSEPTSPPSVIFNIENLCPSSQHLGVAIEMTLSSEAYTSLAWSETAHFSAENTLTRRYAEGHQTVEFALPVYNKSLKYLNFKISRNFKISSPPASYNLHAAKLYCL